MKGYSMIKPYLIYVGNLYPHKNISVLVAAAEILQIDVAIICARSVFADRLPKSRLVHFLGQVSDTELKKLLKNAIAFVFPSLIEGFGLPGLEAMSVGCPVIAARASCLPEIYGAAAIYFDPYNPSELANKINTLLNDSNLRREYIKRGIEQTKKYSWRKMAVQTWKIYQKILP